MHRQVRRHLFPIAAAGLVALAAVAYPPGPARALCRPESLLVAHASFSTAYLPRNIVVADFNGDGILDLATATSHWNPPDQDAVAVLLGGGANHRGDGSFRAPAFYAVGRIPVAVATADFDRDGILDLAVLNYGSGSVSILRGQGSGGVGDGTFALLATLDTGPAPIDLVAGDFRKDGFADVAVLHSLFGIRVLAGSATGAFTVAQNLAVGGTATGNLIASDFNRDGILDLAFARTGPAVAAALGRGAARAGNGTFAPPTNYAGGGAFDVADMNRDGLPDLVMGGDGFLSIALGTGTGGFLAPQPITPGYYAGPVRVADMDRNGFPDIVAGIGTGLYVFSGLGAGASYLSFADPEPISPGSLTQSMAIGDFDSDGRPDVAAGRIDAVANTARLDVLLGRCGGSPAPILDTVADMPNDQGGRLRLKWWRSGEDGLAGNTVTGYTVFQRDPGAGSWRAAASVPATRLNTYWWTANAIQDSTPAGAPMTSFYVSALTLDPAVHYDSEVLGGYSKDDLAPAMPDGFTGAIAPDGGVRLAWAPVAAPDLLHYRLHRLPLTILPAAPPDDLNLIATPADAAYVDRATDTPSGVLFYWIAAEDVHGNVGPYSRLQLFTTDCRRDLNQVLNDTSELTLSAMPARGGTLSAGSPGPPVKKPDHPPPPFVTSYGTALDTVIHDANGSGRASYDLSAGGLHADAVSAGHAKSVEVIATDSYRVHGPAAGTPLTLVVELRLFAARLDACASPPCAGGTAQGAIYAGGSVVEVGLDAGADLAARDTTLSLVLPVTAEVPFTIDVDIRAAAAVGGGISADGVLRFTGLSDGAVISSCGGYGTGARDRRFARVPIGRQPPESGGRPRAAGRDEADVRAAIAAPRLGLAQPEVDPSGALRLRFTLESERRASLQVFDLAGRRLLRRDVGDFGAGEHGIQIDARAWPAGLYFVSVAQDGRAVSRRVGIAR